MAKENPVNDWFRIHSADPDIQRRVAQLRARKKQDQLLKRKADALDKLLNYLLEMPPTDEHCIEIVRHIIDGGLAAIEALPEEE